MSSVPGSAELIAVTLTAPLTAVCEKSASVRVAYSRGAMAALEDPLVSKAKSSSSRDAAPTAFGIRTPTFKAAPLVFG